MPDYLVKFAGPVRYLPGHTKEREVTELKVSSPDPQAALFHAIRVTQGDVGLPVVVLADSDGLAPLTEAPIQCDKCGMERMEHHVCI